jgi:hypothetical protein
LLRSTLASPNAATVALRLRAAARSEATARAREARAARAMDDGELRAFLAGFRVRGEPARLEDLLR